MGSGVKRFNYLADRKTPAFSSIVPTVAIDNRIRGPLAALVTIVILTGALSLVQLSRLHAAQRAYAAVSARATANDASLTALAQVRAEVDRKRQLVADVANVRRISVTHANELASIGNRLPPDTWLSVLHYENGSYSLEGTSKRVAAVGNAILALRDTGGTTRPRLVSLRDDGNGGTQLVHYTLRLETRP